MSKRNLVASAVAGAVALTGSMSAAAETLPALHKEEAKHHAAAAQSQTKINSLYEQTQELLAEYRGVVDETENLKVYNDYLAGLVADQQAGIDSLQRQIDSIEETKQGVVPLMYRMIESLEQFISLDVPINIEKRTTRVERLREIMTKANVSTSEQFRQVLEAYLIELEYGASISSYQGELEFEGQSIAVDIFNLGRTAMYALSLDQKSAWAWDNDSRAWTQLGDEYLKSIIKANRMARKTETFDLIKLPIHAAE